MTVVAGPHSPGRGPRPATSDPDVARSTILRSGAAPLDRGAFASMLSGGDGRTLFITADDWGGITGKGGRLSGPVLAVPVAVPHAGRP